MSDTFPAIADATVDGDVGSWLARHCAELETTLDTAGALLLRRTGLSTESEFREAVAAYSPNRLDYVYRSTPRTDLGSGIYTATEYPPGLPIPLHNENAYQREWPLRLLFFCVRPAEGGTGQTPIARNVEITRYIPASTRQRFADKGLTYIRNYRPDVDLPWQTVFQTDSRAEVEKFCGAKGIEWEWTGADSLRTRQTCPAFATHPRSGETVWFNQAHLFHPSSLNPRTRAAMLETYRESDFPRHVTFGDGSPLDEGELAGIREAYARAAVTFEWRAGDLLFLDNMLAAHGRTPYRGPRRVLVAMCDPFCATVDDRRNADAQSTSAPA
ncbi:MAG: TauD/TfdA family dioxygenase [Vicinamibacterales bacterium]